MDLQHRPDRLLPGLDLDRITKHDFGVALEERRTPSIGQQRVHMGGELAPGADQIVAELAPV